MARLGWMLWALAAAAAAATAVYVVSDLRAAYRRVGSGSQALRTPQGTIEFSQGGKGAPVLVVHGSGGGFDQGELLARALFGDDFHWIAPSRFGYLRSSLPDGATFDDQAHAYARLLDALGIGQVAVVALSHGGPSALLFAVLYPHRVSSLTLLSCGVASATDDRQAQANRKGDLLTTVYSHDLLYWAASHLLRKRLIALLGAEEAQLIELGPAQRVLVKELIDGMNPVAPRAAGVRFDNRAALPNRRIEAIRAPTLVVHARDDGLQLYRNAEFAAAHIPGAQLQAHERGGHLVVAVQLPQVREATRRFILAHPPAP